MPTGKLIRHGTEAGYRAETETGSACERCTVAHREYNRQYTKAGKKLGLKYGRDEVITGSTATRARSGQGFTQRKPTGVPVDALTPPMPSGEGQGVPTTPNLRERLSTALLGATVPDADETPAYLPEDDTPDYLTPSSVDPDPEPSGDWSEVTDEEYVINAAGMKKIQENLGFYLSTVGMTVEILDPYCGPVLAMNLPNMIERWSKVIALYPAAAKMFLSSGGSQLFVWIAAIQATWPVLYALYEHHLGKTVKVEHGQVFRMREQQLRFAQDATTPPMPQYDYSV